MSPTPFHMSAGFSIHTTESLFFTQNPLSNRSSCRHEEKTGNIFTQQMQHKYVHDKYMMRT